MATTPPRMAWPLERLGQALPGVRVQVQAELGSTSTELLERLRQGDTAAQLLVAERQNAGRGRQGRRWQSAPGASLTFSYGTLLAPADWSGLSLAVGAMLADAIEPPSAAAGPRLQLKWPNDLWLADGPQGPWRKLGGILVETVAAAGARACVVGVGLNVQPLAGDVELSSGYACVQELDPRWDAPALLEAVAAPLVAALARFEREGLAAFAGGYARRDLLRGRRVLSSGAAAVDGVAEGVDAQGRLLLRNAAGLQAVGSGEVSVRPQPLPLEA